LRGIVIFFVVVNHAGGRLWERGAAYDLPVVGGLLGGGAVTVFFVVGSFIVTHNLLAELDHGRMDPIRFYLRRLIRIGAQLVPLCLALLLVLRFDPTVRISDKVAAQNITHLLTYTLNEYGQSNFFSVRGEVGHLWYLSVQQQCYLVLPLLLVIFQRRRLALAALLVPVIALVFYWRQQVLDDRGWIFASTMTKTRADALVWGVVLALCLPLLRRYVTTWQHVLWIGCLALLGLKLWLAELSPFAYLGPWSLAFTGVAGVVVVAIWCLTTPTRTSKVLSWNPLVRTGRASLGIFIWHLPVIVVVTRHTDSWPWAFRTLLALAIVAAIVVFMERFVDDRVRLWLARSPVLRLGPTPGQRLKSVSTVS
jgi:peptidoglycan/LPS O-acetylase OafA/YrhL